LKPSKNEGNQVPLEWGEFETLGYQVPYSWRLNQTMDMKT